MGDCSSDGSQVKIFLDICFSAAENDKIYYFHFRQWRQSSCYLTCKGVPPSAALSGADGELSDLEVAEELVATCYQLYARMPAGLAPEIAFFRVVPGHFDFPKAHPPDAGGADLYVKSQVTGHGSAALSLVSETVHTGRLPEARPVHRRRRRPVRQIPGDEHLSIWSRLQEGPLSEQSTGATAGRRRR